MRDTQAPAVMRSIGWSSIDFSNSTAARLTPPHVSGNASRLRLPAGSGSAKRTPYDAPYPSSAPRMGSTIRRGKRFRTIRVGLSGSPVISMRTAPSSTMITRSICDRSEIEAKRLSTWTLWNFLAARSRPATVSMVPASKGAPISMPARRRTSSSLVSTFPWIWTETMISSAISSAKVRPNADATYDGADGTWRPASAGPTARVHVRLSASSAHTSALFDADLRRDVGTPVVRVVQRVAHVELTGGHRHSRRDFERARQPDLLVLRERLRHRHRGLDVVQVQQPLGREEIEADVVERVLHDLMRGRLDPERHERHLVH